MGNVLDVAGIRKFRTRVRGQDAVNLDDLTTKQSVQALIDASVSDVNEASEIATSTTNFNGVLTNDANSNTVQKCLDLLDDHSHAPAKIDFAAASRILGRGSAGGAGAGQELTLGASLIMNGTTIERAALTGDVTAAQNGNATTIANDAVTYAKMQNVSAASRVIGRGSAGGAGDPQELSLGASLIMNGTTIERAALTGDVTASQNGNATTIANDAVTTAKVINDAVTYAKMQNVSAASRIIGRGSAGGSGDPEELTLGASFVMNGTVIERAALTGHVTASQNGNATTIANSVITTAMLAAAAFSTDATFTSPSDTQLASSLAIKSYVDNAISGFKWKQPCRVATASNITLSGSQNIDGVVDLVNGDRILVRAQTTASQNGIYVYNSAGSWSRATDADTGSELQQATMFVAEGSAYADTQWTCTQDSIVLGTTSISFVQVSGAGTYSAGSGLVLSGNQFAIETATNSSTGVLNTHIRHGGALSVIGRSANSSGAVADIVGSNNTVLRVTSSVLGFGGIDTAHINSGAVTSDKMAADSVLTAAIANANVTLAKLPNQSQYTIIGRVSAGSGSPEVLTAAQLITVFNTADGTGSGTDADLLDGQHGAYYQDAGNLNAGTLLAARMPALTGDVTSTVNTVATTIANDVVTYAKMQNVSAASRIIGRGSAGGAGDPQEMTVGASLIINGTVIERAALTGDVTAAQNNNATTIANDVVTYAKMQNVSVASRIIGRGSAGGAGDPEELALGVSLVMNATTIERAALTGDVTASQNSNATTIASNAVTTGKILDGNVTLAKLANINQYEIIGRISASAGVPQALTPANLITIFNTADGAGSGTDADLLDGEEGSHYEKMIWVCS